MRDEAFSETPALIADDVLKQRMQYALHCAKFLGDSAACAAVYSEWRPWDENEFLEILAEIGEQYFK